MIFMPFNEWLQNWIDENKSRRDFWGPMAYDLERRLRALGERTVLSLADISIAPALLGFELGTSERWLFNEIEMRYLDEKRKAEERESFEDKNLRRFVAQMPGNVKAALLHNKTHSIWCQYESEYLVKQGLIEITHGVHNFEFTPLGLSVIEILEEKE